MDKVNAHLKQQMDINICPDAKFRFMMTISESEPFDPAEIPRLSIIKSAHCYFLCNATRDAIQVLENDPRVMALEASPPNRNTASPEEERVPTSDEQTFLDLFIAGELSADAIDDFIEKWHMMYSTPEIEKYPPLHHYLGMTESEFQHWLDDANCLPDIAKARTIPDASLGHS